jgi:hypothetical protein
MQQEQTRVSKVINQNSLQEVATVEKSKSTVAGAIGQALAVAASATAACCIR